MGKTFRAISNAGSQFVIAVFSSIFLIPLSCIIPKKKQRIVVIGRQNGLFTDNAKHFFLYLCTNATPQPDVIYLVFSRETYRLLANSPLPVCFYPGLRSIVYLLTANMVAVDSAEWIMHGKFQLAFRSKVIQLWHGAPLKEIEIPLFLRRITGYPKPAGFLLKIYKIVTGRHAAYELVVTTSSFFTEKAFKPAFRAKHFIDTGYPRNDALFADVRDMQLNASLYMNTDLFAIKKIMSRRKSGARIVLYAPTFRKEVGDPFSSALFDLNRLDSFASEHNLFIVLKLHPVVRDNVPEIPFASLSVYNATCDIYPVLNLFHALVTDYSSIYFDFLLLDRPIIFFPYDYDEYIRNDRPLLFDYVQMAPGHICMCQDELETAMLKIDDDMYREKRNEILNLVFTHKDNAASARIWQILKDNYIS